MGADKRMPVAAVAALNPGHIHLHQRTATPLPGFEDYGADGTSGQAVALQHGQHLALRHVEAEGHVGALGLVLYGNAAQAPVLEVVAAAQARPCPGIAAGKSITGVGKHGRRHICPWHSRLGSIHQAPSRLVGAAQRVVPPAFGESPAATTVLRQHFLYPAIHISHSGS